MEKERCMELLRSIIDRVSDSCGREVESLCDIGFTEEELIHDFGFGREKVCGIEREGNECAEENMEENMEDRKEPPQELKRFDVTYWELYSGCYEVNAFSAKEAEEKVQNGILDGTLKGPDTCCDSGYDVGKIK